MRKSGLFVLLILFASNESFTQSFRAIPGEILSSVVSNDQSLLAVTTPDTVYVMQTSDLRVGKKWAHQKETPVLLGFHPANNNVLLMQKQNVRSSLYSGGLLNYGMTIGEVLDNYRKTDRKYSEIPQDTVYMWDVSKQLVVNSSPGSFYFQFGSSNERFTGIANKVYPYEYQGQIRYGTRGAEIISRENGFEKVSNTKRSCRQLLLSPAQDKFAVSWRDGYINDSLWFSVSVMDFSTHETLLSLERISDMPMDISFSNDGKLLAVAAKWTGSEPVSIRIYSIGDKKQVGEIKEVNDVTDLVFGKDNKELYFRSDRLDWYAWSIAEARYTQKIWSNLATLSQINAAIYLDDKLLMIGANWSPLTPDRKNYAIELLSLGDLAVISKTTTETEESFADSSTYTMTLNDVPVNNTDAYIRFSDDKKIFTSVEESLLQVWNTSKRKKVLQLGFEKEIKAFPDRTGKHILIIENKIQKRYSEYMLHVIRLSNSTKKTSAFLEAGNKAMDGSSLQCNCIPDPATDNSWFCVDGSATIWKMSGKDFEMQPLVKMPGAALRKLILNSSGRFFAGAENELKKNDIWYWDSGTNPLKMVSSGAFSDFTAVADELWLWSTGRYDSTIQVWKNNKYNRTIRFPGTIEKVDVSPGRRDAVVQYELKSEAQIQRFVSGIPQTAKNTAQISSQFYMLATDELLAEDNGFHTYYANATVAIPWTVSSPRVLSNTNFDVSATGRYLLFSNLFVDLKETEQWVTGKFTNAALLHDSGRLEWLEIYRTGTYGDQRGGFSLIKLRSGRTDTVKSKTWISLPASDDFYYVHDRIVVSPNKKWAITYVESGWLNKGMPKAAPILWNLDNMVGKTITGLPESFSVAFKTDGGSIWFHHIAFNDKDLTSEEQIFQYDLVSSKLNKYTNANGKKLPVEGKDKFMVARHNVQYWKADGDSLRLEKSYFSTDDLESVVFSERTGKIIAATSSGSLIIWQKDGNASPVARINVHSSKIEQLVLRGNRVFTLSSNAEIGITDIQTNNLSVIVKTMILDDEIRIAMHSGKYYRVDPDLMRYMHFVKNGELYPLTSFELQGNRPDKVYESIGIADTTFIAALRQSWINRVQRAGFDPTRLDDLSQRPQITWDRGQLPALSTDGSIRVKFSLQDSEAKLKKLLLRVNGVPVGTRHGIPVKAGSGADMEQVVQLNEGMNNISLTAINANGKESVEENLDIRYEPAQKKKSRLLYVGIGVSDYADTAWNLRYAAKDAGDIAGYLRYAADSVTLHTVTNEKATREGIIAVKELLKQTSVDDIVVLSFAGHGMLAKDIGFVFAPHDMNFERPEQKGIPMSMIEDLLDDIPARKRLLLLDACHSGEEWSADSSGARLPEGVTAYRGGIVTNKNTSSGASRASYLLMKELFSDFSRGNGAFMISAAGSNEFAYEGVKGKENGVFTRSFLDAFQELRSGGSSREKIVRVRDLRKLIYKKVTALTNGLQNPTSRQENGWWNWSF